MFLDPLLTFARGLLGGPAPLPAAPAASDPCAAAAQADARIEAEIVRRRVRHFEREFLRGRGDTRDDDRPSR